MSTSRQAELSAFGCISPEWFLRDHIPRYAAYYGFDIAEAYSRVLAEVVALDVVRKENFGQMIESGMAQRMLNIYARRGKAGLLGERPLVVMDNHAYMMRDNARDDPSKVDITYFDPGISLAIGNFHTMDDPVPVQCAGSINIGRPNSDGELWLGDGITVEDYDVVRDCFSRLLALRVSGITPHMQSHMDHIFIPFTLGSAEHPYDPNKFHHGPVDYTGITTELKVAT